MDPAKLKVVELRAELSSRGLDTKGVKAVLVERLKKALENSGGEGSTQDEPEVTETETIAPRTPRGSRSRRRSPSPRIDTEVLTPRRTSRRKSSVEEPAPTPVKIHHSLAQITESEIEQDDPPSEEKTEISESSETLYSINMMETKSLEVEEVSQNVESQDDIAESNLETKELHNTSADSKDIDQLPEDSKPTEQPLSITEVETGDADVSTTAKSEIQAPPDEISTSEPESKVEEKEMPQAISTTMDQSCVEEPTTSNIVEEQEDKQATPTKTDDICSNITQITPKKTEPEVTEMTEISTLSSSKADVEESKTTPPASEDFQEIVNKAEESCEVMDTVEEAEKSYKDDSVNQEESKMQVDDIVSRSTDSNLEESDSNKDNLSESVKLDDSEVASDIPVDSSKTRKKEKRSRWGNFQESKQEAKDKIAKEETKSGESRQVTKRKQSRSRSPVKMLCEEDEVKLENENTNVLLSWYDSDLHLSIDSKTLCSATPLTTGALCHVWAGARTNKGVQSGCVAYEVLINKHLKVDQNDGSHLIRIGFSTFSTSLQLGEEPLSFGYESSGKFVSNNEFNDYGTKISESDIVGAYLDLDSTPCTIKFTVNGKEQGIAKEFDKALLEGKALYPHILTKNIAYKINVGQNGTSFLNRPKTVHKKDEAKKETVKPVETEGEKPKAESTEKLGEGKPADVEMTNVNEEQLKKNKEKQAVEATVKDDVTDVSQTELTSSEEMKQVPEIHFILSGYEYIGKLSADQLVDGPPQPDTRKECEVLMLCGLPGVGKTHWVEKWVREHPEKRYTVLGTHELINRMKINGEAKKSFYKGSWQSLLEACSKSISDLVNIAGKRRRNIIIDQNNVYTAVQVRKISNFGGFVRKAIVIVPSQEEWDKRKSTKGDLIAEEVTDTEMLTMKANFVLPEVNDYFDQVIFAELSEDEAKELITKYNTEGKDAGYAMRPAKRSRFDNSADRSADRHSNSSNQSSRQSSDRRYNDRNRSDRRSNDRSQSFNQNRRGGNDHRKHNDRMDRGGPHRWGPPRFGGPPPPPQHWGAGGRGGHREQWRGGGGAGRDRAQQPGWRSGGGDRGHHGGGRGEHGHRGARGGDHGQHGNRGGTQNRGGVQPHRGDGGRWNNRGGGRGGGGDRRGAGRGPHPPGAHWTGNNAAWNQDQQQWNQQQWGGAQNWNQDQAAQQDWSGQNWNQNWQQNWNQQNWGNGWKGYGAQNWSQYWNQWNQQGQQAEGNQTGAAGGNTNTSSSNQQYPAQFNTEGNGANPAPDQMAQVYQSWAQYAQAFANYGQQSVAAAGAASSNQKTAGMTDKKKKK
uniref:Putative heteroproteinous nuclear ribonucleoprotein u-like protein 1 n=1 Tax=Xenopsylla cheopis TaxID=163159 RepID=A0A6M2DSX5_XENCH